MRLLGVLSDGTSTQDVSRMKAVDAVRSFPSSLILLPVSQPCLLGTDCLPQVYCARKQRRRAEQG
jgi:hypothetical protein